MSPLSTRDAIPAIDHGPATPAWLLAGPWLVARGRAHPDPHETGNEVYCFEKHRDLVQSTVSIHAMTSPDMDHANLSQLDKYSVDQHRCSAMMSEAGLLLTTLLTALFTVRASAAWAARIRVLPVATIGTLSVPPARSR